MSTPVARKLRVGILVNPIAGLGGPRALKGSDDPERLAPIVAETTWDEEGARSFGRTASFIRLLDPKRVVLVTPPGVMGEDVVKRATLMGGPVFEIVRIPGWDKEFGHTTRDDTALFLERLRKADVDLVAFAGGDGTALDVATASKGSLPLVGIPAGVKMFSPVFAQTPEVAAALVNSLSVGFPTHPVDVLDLDESSYLKGAWIVRAHALARLPEAEGFQTGKGAADPGEATALEDLQIWFRETQRPGTTYVFGAGATTGAIKESLGGGTPLGIDVWRDGAFVATDADEATILDALGESGEARLLVSPTGGQGAVLGRGTAQLTVAVLERIGAPNILIVATPSKLRGLRSLFVDTGDADLDRSFPDYVKVRTDPFTEKLFPLKRGMSVAR